MIAVVLHEQLGNQLFQWATGFALARRHGVPLRLIATNYGRSGRGLHLRRFDVGATFENPLPGLVYERILKKPLYDFRKFRARFGAEHVYRSEFEVLPSSCLLNGMFQSWRYFHHEQEGIREELHLDDAVVGSRSRDLMRIRSSPSVALHVRRTDYVGPRNQSKFAVCDGNYYRKSMDLMESRLGSPWFFVFSDDIEWCRAEIRGDRVHYCSMPGKCSDPLVDFFLMMQCDHQIISNSTFSWWAAYLNANKGKIVFCPSRWFNTSEARIEDKLCPGWELVEV